MGVIPRGRLHCDPDRAGTEGEQFRTQRIFRGSWAALGEQFVVRIVVSLSGLWWLEMVN